MELGDLVSRLDRNLVRLVLAAVSHAGGVPLPRRRWSSVLMGPSVFVVRWALPSFRGRTDLPRSGPRKAPVARGRGSLLWSAGEAGRRWSGVGGRGVGAAGLGRGEGIASRRSAFRRLTVVRRGAPWGDYVGFVCHPVAMQASDVGTAERRRLASSEEGWTLRLVSLPVGWEGWVGFSCRRSSYFLVLTRNVVGRLPRSVSRGGSYLDPLPTFVDVVAACESTPGVSVDWEAEGVEVADLERLVATRAGCGEPI